MMIRDWGKGSEILSQNYHGAMQILSLLDPWSRPSPSDAHLLAALFLTAQLCVDPSYINARLLWQALTCAQFAIQRWDSWVHDSSRPLPWAMSVNCGPTMVVFCRINPFSREEIQETTRRNLEAAEALAEEAEQTLARERAGMQR